MSFSVFYLTRYSIPLTKRLQATPPVTLTDMGLPHHAFREHAKRLTTAAVDLRDRLDRLLHVPPHALQIVQSSLRTFLDALTSFRLQLESVVPPGHSAQLALPSFISVRLQSLLDALVQAGPRATVVEGAHQLQSMVQGLREARKNMFTRITAD